MIGSEPAVGELRVRLADHETCLVSKGDGDPILFVHAIGLDREMWRGVVEALPRGRRIAYDLRGHGCAAGAPRPFSLRLLADDLAALLDALGYRQAHVVGLSFGGAVAQEFALAYPDRLVALTLVCTPASGSPVYLERAEAVRNEGIEPAIPATLERWFTREALAQDTPVVRYARERLRTDDAEDFAAAWDALAALGMADRLGGIDVATKVIAAELDVSTPPEMMRELAAAIPGAEFHIVPHAPHMLSLERPLELAALIAS